MTKSQRKPKAVKGALLIMVLTIMFVLIFLLAGTIAVVYSSHNRVMKRYEESQAYYTARSVLDTYVYTFLFDNANKSGDNGTTDVDDYRLKNASGGKIVEKNDATQARALEIDLYGMTVDMDVSTDTIERDPGTNDTNFPDWAKEMIVKRVLGITAKGSIEKSILLANGATASDFTGTDGGYSKGLEAVRDNLEGDNSGTSPTNAEKYKYWRRVILDAANPSANAFGHYDSSAPTGYDVYVGADHTADTWEYDSTPTGSTYNTKAYYDQFIPKDDSNGDEYNTMYYIVPSGAFASYGTSSTAGTYGKLVDTVAQRHTYDSSLGSSYNPPDAVIKVKLLERSYHFDPGIPDAGSSDFKMLFDSGSRQEDYIKVSVSATVYYDGEPTTTSIIYKTKYTPTPSADKALTSFGGIAVGTTSGDGVDGGLASLDPSLQDVNVSKMNGSWFYNGDVKITANNGDFILNDEECAVIRGNLLCANPCLFNNATGTTKGFLYVGGNIGADDSGNLSAQPVKSNVTTIGKTLFTHAHGTPTFAKDVYVDTLHVKGNTGQCKLKVSGTLYCNNIVVEDTGYAEIMTVDTTTKVITFNKGSNVDISKLVINKSTGKITANGVTESLSGYTINVTPDGGGQTDYVQTMTTAVKMEYDNSSHYSFSSTDFTKTFTMPDSKTYTVDTPQSRYGQYFDDPTIFGADGDFTFAYSNANDINTNIGTAIETGEERAHQYTNADTCKLSSGTTVSTSTTSLAAGGNYILPATGDTNGYNLEINTDGAGTTVVQLGSGTGTQTITGNINVKGSGAVAFLIPEGSSVEFGSGGHNFSLTYENTLNSISSGLVNVGTASPPTVSPQIEIIAGQGSDVYVQRDSYLMGYYYGPQSSFKVSTSSHPPKFKYNDGTSVKAEAEYCILGSIVCGNYDAANSMVCFLSRYADTNIAGNSYLGWDDVYFMREGD